MAKPLEILARRWPSHYPSQRQLFELSGKDGTPIVPPSLNPFNVRIVLATEPGQQPPKWEIRPYEKVGGNGDERT
jgi:hypothetical protein